MNYILPVALLYFLFRLLRPSAPFICPLSSYPCSLKSRLDPFSYKEVGEGKILNCNCLTVLHRKSRSLV